MASPIRTTTWKARSTRDEPQHVAVAQHGAAQREPNLVPLLDPLTGRPLRRRQRDPAVAAQATVEADRPVGTYQQRIVDRDGGGVRPDQDVAGPGAGEELVAVGRSAAALHSVRLRTAPEIPL